MINNELQSIIDNQIKDYLLLKDPSNDDITPENNLITIDNGDINVLSHPNIQDQHRLDIFIDILKKINISNISCKFLLNTLDIPKNSYIKTLCFSKKRNQPFITIPNVHVMINAVNNFLDQVNTFDIPFDNKINKSFFCGSPTGKKTSYNLGKRVKYISDTLYDHTRPNHYCILTNYGCVGIDYQLKFKYLVNIDGNSCSWDRMYWQMSSNSLTWYYNRDNSIVELYHELLKDNIHYVPINRDLDSVYNFFENDSSSIEFRNSIINNGKNFITKYFHDNTNHHINIIEYILNSINAKT